MLKPKLKKTSLSDYKNKDINLLPKDIIEKKKNKYRLSLVVLATTITVASMLGYYFYLLHQIKVVSNENKVKIQHIEELMAKEKQQQLLSVLQQKIDIKSQHLMDIEKSSASMPAIVTILESNLPKDIHFLNLSISGDGIISISGLSISEVSIAEFIHNLKKSKAFDEVFVSSITYSNGADASKLYSFTLLCKNRGQ